MLHVVDSPPLVSCSDNDDTVTDPVKLATPDNLAISNATADSFDVSWDAVQNAASYIYQIDDGEEKTTDKTSVAVNGLTPDKEYTFKVKATGDAGSEWTDSQWATITGKTLPVVQKAGFTIEVKEEELLPNSFTLTVTPDDPTMTYYASYADNEEWEDYLDGNDDFDGKLLQESKTELWQTMAPMLGSSYPGIISTIVYTGTQKFTFSSHVLPETHYYGYVYGWGLDGSILTDVVYIEFDTPEPGASRATVTITYGKITSNSMQIICTPDDNVTSYFQLVDTSAVVDDFYAKGGTDAELIQIVMDRGDKMEGVDDYTWINLSPETEYQMSIVGFDDQGGQFFVTSRNSTLAYNSKPDPVDSPLFEKLPGVWSGTQTVQGETEAEEINFLVNVELTESSWNYREYNQIALKFQNYAGYTYYDSAALMADGWNEAEAILDYGPKLLLNVEADGTLWIDGSIDQPSFYNWSDAGKVYMVGYGGLIDLTQNFEVTLSDDDNTMTISFPIREFYPDFYPSVATELGGWRVVKRGYSDIVLKRSETPAALH